MANRPPQSGGGAGSISGMQDARCRVTKVGLGQRVSRAAPTLQGGGGLSSAEPLAPRSQAGALDLFLEANMQVPLTWASFHAIEGVQPPTPVNHRFRSASRLALQTRADFFWNLGGHPPFDRSPEVESRETNKYYVRDTSEKASSAWVTLQGTTSNIDAIGSRVEVTYENNEKRYYFIHSTTGFQSQNSKELLIPLFGFDQARLEVTWSRGNKSQHVITSGVNHRIVEP